MKSQILFFFERFAFVSTHSKPFLALTHRDDVGVLSYWAA